MVTVRWRVAVLTTAVVAAALTGCSSDGHPRKPFPSPTRPRSEAQLRQQAQAKLTRSPEVKLSWTGAVKGPGTTPRSTVGLADGRPYVVEAACAGTGAFELSWITKAAHSGNLQVRCDGPPLHYAFTGGDLLSFTFETYHPTSGVVAWQIIPAKSANGLTPAP